MDDKLIAEIDDHLELCRKMGHDSTSVRLLQRARDRLGDLPHWVSVEEFQSEANEGWCWIVYKGRVVEAYHDHEQVFRFHRLSQNCYMTECITAVMPWMYPTFTGKT